MERLDRGLFTLQMVDLVIADLYTSSADQEQSGDGDQGVATDPQALPLRIDAKLKEKGRSLEEIVSVLRGIVWLCSNAVLLLLFWLIFRPRYLKNTWRISATTSRTWASRIGRRCASRSSSIVYPPMSVVMLRSWNERLFQGGFLYKICADSTGKVCMYWILPCDVTESHFSSSRRSPCCLSPFATARHRTPHHAKR